MRGVILRESDILIRANSGEFEKKTIDTLRILIKHYLDKGKSVEEAINEINLFMENNYQNYKPSKWSELIENTVKIIHKTGNYKLIDIDSIEIYESEWENILALEDRQLEKLAFVLLVYQKINEIKNPNSNGWINNTLTDIFKEAAITNTFNTKEKKLLLNKLYKLKYIKQKNTVDATSLQINFRELENKKIKFKVNNLNYVITYFYQYRDGVDYISCCNCNKRIIKKNNRIKYCGVCAKIINKNKTLEKYYNF